MSTHLIATYLQHSLLATSHENQLRERFSSRMTDLPFSRHEPGVPQALRNLHQTHWQSKNAPSPRKVLRGEEQMYDMVDFDLSTPITFVGREEHRLLHEVVEYSWEVKPPTTRGVYANGIYLSGQPGMGASISFSNYTTKMEDLPSMYQVKPSSLISFSLKAFTGLYHPYYCSIPGS